MKYITSTQFIILLAIITVVLGIAIALKTPLEIFPSSPRGGVSEERRSVLDTPPNTASEEEKRQHFERVQSLAVESEYLDIKNCAMTPLVLKVKQRGSFIARNNDAVPHIIVIDKDTRFEIPAEGSTPITAEFGKGPGVYGYGCDASPTAAGMMVVYE